MGTLKRRGGQPANQNAVKHGYYARYLPPDHPHLVECARRLESVDEELAMLRVKFRGLLAAQDTDFKLIVKAVHAIVRLVKIKEGLAPIGSAPRMPPMPVDASSWIRSFTFCKPKPQLKNREHDSNAETPP